MIGSTLTKFVAAPPAERIQALKIAIKILDTCGTDSEHSNAILARQFIANLNLIEQLEQDLRRWRTSRDADGRRL
jgi:hypothetical protein